MEIDQWPQPELERYQAYAAEHLLPLERIEIYHAQAAFMVARTMGGYKGGLEDFLLFSNGGERTEQPQGGLPLHPMFDDFMPE